jgi:hypothetical protein
MAHWDRPRKDCWQCQFQKRVQEAIRHGIAPERIEQYLEDRVPEDMEMLDAKVRAEGL